MTIAFVSLRNNPICILLITKTKRLQCWVGMYVGQWVLYQHTNFELFFLLSTCLGLLVHYYLVEKCQETSLKRERDEEAFSIAYFLSTKLIFDRFRHSWQFTKIPHYFHCKHHQCRVLQPTHSLVIYSNSNSYITLCTVEATVLSHGLDQLLQ